MGENYGWKLFETDPAVLDSFFANIHVCDFQGSQNEQSNFQQLELGFGLENKERSKENQRHY